ncbi:MAG: hypothetical protein FWB93_05400, partial [Oscillospiraceae bacterium]|nr:hypothetical protein [Oscillospiraceae bacterium]
MKKRKTFALIAIIAVLSLTACGGEDSVDYNNDYNLEANTANDNQHGCVEAYYTNENEIEYDENYSYTVESEEPIVEEISPEVPPIAEETHAVESPPTQQSTPPQQNYAPPPAPNPPPAVQPPTIAQQPAPPVIPSPPVIEPPAPPSPTYVPTPPVYVPAPPPPP